MVLITKKVYLSPEYLDQDIKAHLLREVSKRLVGQCTQNDGYILDVTRITQILSNEDTYFTIEIDAETLKPEEGTIFTGTVGLVLADGVFVVKQDLLRLMIPDDELKNWDYDPVNRCYTQEDGSVLQEGDQVQVRISAVRYDKGQYSCLGTLA